MSGFRVKLIAQATILAMIFTVVPAMEPASACGDVGMPVMVKHSTHSTSGVTCPGGGDGDGGESTTFESNWAGEAFTEKVDPLERFDVFTVTPVGGGFAEVRPVPYPQTSSTGSGNVVHNLTNQLIHDRVVELNLTPLEIIAEVERVLQEHEEDALNASRIHLEAGEYLEAVDVLRDTHALITYWCGPAHELDEFQWVIGIPRPTSCSGGDEDAVTFLTTVEGVPDLRASADIPDPDHPDADPDVWVREINLTFVVSGMNLDNPTRYTQGFGYASHHMGADTVTGNDPWAIEAALADINMGARNPDRAAINWTASTVFDDADAVDSHVFESGDVLMYTRGSFLNRSASISWDVATAGSQFNASLVGTTAEPNALPSWHVDLAFDSAVFDRVRAHTDLALANATVLELAKFPGEFTLIYDALIVDGSYKHAFIVRNAEKGAFRDAELKGSTYVEAGTAHRLTFQVKGVPEVETENPQNVTAPQEAHLRIDLGEGDGSPVVDFYKSAGLGKGFFRTVILNSTIPGFTFNATVDYANRVILAAQHGDAPWVLHGVNHAGRGSSSVDMLTAAGASYESRMDSTTQDDADASAWSYSLPDDCSDAPCNGTIAKGVDVDVKHGTAPRHWWWHIHDGITFEDGYPMYSRNDDQLDARDDCKPPDMEGACP